MSKAQCPLAPEVVAKMQNEAQNKFALLQTMNLPTSLNYRGMKNASALSKHYPNGFSPNTFRESGIGKAAIFELLMQGMPFDRIICLGGTYRATYMCQELYDQYKHWCDTKVRKRNGLDKVVHTSTTEQQPAGPTAGPRQLELISTGEEPKTAGPTAGPQQPTPAHVPQSGSTADQQRKNSRFKPDTSVDADIIQMMGVTEQQEALTQAQAQFLYDELHDLIFVNGIEEVIECLDYVMVQFAINSMGQSADEYDADCLKMVRNVRDIFIDCRKKETSRQRQCN